MVLLLKKKLDKGDKAGLILWKHVLPVMLKRVLTYLINKLS